MKKQFPLLLVMAVLLGSFWWVSHARALTIHTRYFESYDVLITDTSLQVFSVSPLEDEKLTIVVYALQEGAQPALALFDPTGRMVAENLNPENQPVAAVQIPVEMNGMYTYAISRKSDVGGLMRVMVFEGDPVDFDITLIDVAAPFLPSRAFLISGNREFPIEVYTEIVRPLQSTEEGVRYFVSRGSAFSIPPIDERLLPVESFSWVNDQDTYYTINVRAIPEIQESAKANAFFSWHAIFDVPFEYLLRIGNGSQGVVRVARPICEAEVIAGGVGTTLYAGPGFNYAIEGTLAADTTVEIVGRNESNTWLQIVNPEQDDGNSWIPRVAYAADSRDCQRVVPTYYNPISNGADVDQSLLNTPEPPRGNSGDTSGGNPPANANPGSNPQPNPVPPPSSTDDDFDDDSSSDSSDDDDDDDDDD